MIGRIHKLFGAMMLSAMATMASAQVAVPYSIDFSTVKSATDFIDTDWTILDASEKTGKTWGPGSCYTDDGSISDMVTAKDYNSAYNDYLISSAITLKAGKTYEVKTLTALLSGLDMELTLEIGTSNTDASKFKTVATLTPEDKGYNAEAVKTSTVTVDADGDYYLAILAKGEKSGASARAHAFSFSIAEKAGGSSETEEAVALPYSADFKAATEGWSVITEQTTGGTSWAYEPEYGFYDKATGTFFADVKLKSGNSGEDYYVSPAFQLEAGKTYTVSTLAAFNNTKGALDVSLAIGTSRTDAATYSTVKKLSPFTDNYSVDNTEETAITVEESGVYHLAFVGKTVDADNSTIAHLFSFSIVEGTPTAIQTITGATTKKSDAIFNLSGQKVDKATKGLFIINGKKVMK